jgi:hypothetical protein
LPHQVIQLFSGCIRGRDYKNFLISFQCHQRKATGEFSCAWRRFSEQVKIDLAGLSMSDFAGQGSKISVPGFIRPG